MPPNANVEIGYAGMSKSAKFFFQLRPYILESSGSRLISEDKLVMAQLVLWWVTTWEY